MPYTNAEIKMNFKGIDIVIPKGTRVTHQTACGVDPNYNFIADLSFINKKKYPIMYYDAYYYGINVPKEFVTE
jgi:hypothetical protein